MLIKLLFILLSIFIAWQLFVYLRTHPEAFSHGNLSRSFFTLGLLALTLIIFIGGLVFLIKN